MIKLFILLNILLYSICAGSQTKWHEKINNISFSSDTVKSNLTFLTKYGAIEPISSSDAVVEIRRYHRYIDDITAYSIDVIRIFKDYAYGMLYWCKVDGRHLKKSYPDSVGKVADGRVLQRNVRQTKQMFDSEEVLKILSESDIFNMKDQTKLIDSLTLSGRVLNNPCKGIHHCGDRIVYYEVKLENKVRSFHMRNVDYYPVNKELELDIFKRNHEIHMLFKSFRDNLNYSAF